MSLPREWSSRHQVEFFVGGIGGGVDNENSSSASATVTPAASQDTVVVNHHQIDENMNKHHQDLLGSLFSIHSAPVFDVSNNDAGSNLPKR